MTCPLIITAHGVDAKLLNRLLLHLRDWRNGTPTDWDHFVLTPTTEPMNVNDERVGTGPPLQTFPVNGWEGMSFDQVEHLMVAMLADHGPRLFVVLDDQGVRDQTLIVAEQADEYDSDESDDEWKLERVAYNKARVPWFSVFEIWVNLDIAHMGWWQFAVEDDPMQQGGWWTFQVQPDDDTPEEELTRRNAAIVELQELDLA